MLCTVYRSEREPGVYVYVERKDGLGRVPEALLAKLGTSTEVMTFKLTPERKLARVKAADVLAAIAARGYFLQLPPEMMVSRFSEGE